MSTKFDLIYIVPVTVEGALVRKLIFAPQGVSKDDPAYFHASTLAGPWRKQTRVCKGTIDGAAITTPFVLPLRLKNGTNGESLSLNGVRLQVVDPTIEAATDKAGKALIGKDEKPIFNLRGGAIEITTYTFAAGDDDAAFGAASAPTVPVQTDDEAFA